jgi:hypothetical protein
VFVAFGRGVVLDHAPRWWERIWLRFSLLLRPGEAPRPLDDLIEPAGPHGPDIDGTAGAADRVPRRPPDKPLAGAVALPEPASGSICPAAVSMSGSALRSSGVPGPGGSR